MAKSVPLKIVIMMPLVLTPMSQDIFALNVVALKTSIISHHITSMKPKSVQLRNVWFVPTLYHITKRKAHINAPPTLTTTMIQEK